MHLCLKQQQQGLEMIPLYIYFLVFFFYFTNNADQFYVLQWDVGGEEILQLVSSYVSSFFFFFHLLTVFLKILHVSTAPMHPSSSQLQLPLPPSPYVSQATLTHIITTEMVAEAAAEAQIMVSVNMIPSFGPYMNVFLYYHQWFVIFYNCDHQQWQMGLKTHLHLNSPVFLLLFWLLINYI